MHYVYVLQSKVDKNLYIGVTADLKTRFQRHNTGKIKSTKSRAPFILVYYEAYKDKRDATKREKQLKEHKPKSDLKKQIKFSLKRV